MKIKRAACVPLVTHDPFFSIWSPADQLHDCDTVHWSGALQRLKGHLTVDGKKYVFLGERIGDSCLKQTELKITATATQYRFENEKVILACRFTSPLLLDDPLLVSRPCTYIDLTVIKKTPCRVEAELSVLSDMVQTTKDYITGFYGKHKNFSYAMMGRAVQQPLSGSDDRTTINWGYAYLACPEGKVQFEQSSQRLCLKATPQDGKALNIVIAYDDLLSINYFGQWHKAYWTKYYPTILDAIAASISHRDEVLQRCDALDRQIENSAIAIGGEQYAYLCNLSYRQSVSAHKLIEDDNGDLIFLSKENASNGCIGTVDVSYPSVPLYLFYNPELVKGMLRPIFQFARYPVWEYDYAPHDVGRYPYAWGQVYASRLSFDENCPDRHIWDSGKSAVYPPFYLYPAGSDIYDPKFQMPVEECGNILIMTAAVCKAENSADFAKPYMDLLRKWKDYLVKYGADPGDQLCTDDFAGHMEHNTNLSIKAIMGLEAYGILCDMLGDPAEGEKHHNLARQMASDWEKRANAGDHYALAFGSADTWSLKYNLVWDKLWNTGLFSDRVYEKEISWYLRNSGKYGAPLDSRQVYTKSDWIAWCAAMAGEKGRALLSPVAEYLENTPDRVPFGDWYDTESGIHHMFVGRSVQGGIFMPLLYNKKGSN